MCEVRGAVQWINDPPNRLARLLRSYFAGLLSQYRVIRVSRPYSLDDELLAFLVRYRDEIGAPFELHVLFSTRVVFENVARGSGKFDGSFEIFHELQ
jgi:hypothetical protein